MGKLWAKFRERASHKADRGHWGLAWSVSAGYFLAGSIFLRSFHETGWLMKVFDWLSLAFFVFGGAAVYMAFAVAMRWPPHHPRKRDMEICDLIEGIYLHGLTLLQDWEKLTILSNLLIPIPSVAATVTQHKYDTQAQTTAETLFSWVTESEKKIGDLLGNDMAARYRMAPDPTKRAPSWTENSIWVGLWGAVEGRLVWIRAWMREQVDL